MNICGDLMKEVPYWIIRSFRKKTLMQGCLMFTPRSRYCWAWQNTCLSSTRLLEIKTWGQRFKGIMKNGCPQMLVSRKKWRSGLRRTKFWPFVTRLWSSKPQMAGVCLGHSKNKPVFCLATWDKVMSFQPRQITEKSLRSWTIWAIWAKKACFFNSRKKRRHLVLLFLSSLVAISKGDCEDWMNSRRY